MKRKKRDLDEQIFWLICAFVIALGIVLVISIIIGFIRYITQTYGVLGVFGIGLVGLLTFIIWCYFIDSLSD